MKLGAPSCSPWFPNSARCTCQRVRPRRTNWIETHGLRVCLAYQEITPQGARCPGSRCSTAVLAALALGNTAPPPAQSR